MSAYTNELVLRHIAPLTPKTIIECGTCNGQDTLDLVSTYNPDRVYTFEANPENIPWCRTALAADPRITLVEMAVNDSTGTVTFYPGDIQRCKFPSGGISSMFPFKPGYEQFQLKDGVTVPCTRLDDFLATTDVKTVDLLCLDVQGAELATLRGLGTRIADVRAVVAEVWFTAYYAGTPLFDELEAYMLAHGFTRKELYRFDDYGDALYVRTTA